MSSFFHRETFRGDYTYFNSAEAIRRFPFPFREDHYLYSVNMEPHTPGAPGSVYEHAFDVDEHYVAECEDRALTLQNSRGRYVALPHMMDAQWDALELLMTSMAADYPQHFALERDGSRWTWTNRPLGIHDRFIRGDASTLPMEPLEYITRQAQGDYVLLDQREGNLWADAGMVTTQADWSLAFDTGMSFHEWHGPVPLAREIGVFDRALKFLMMLRHGSPMRRLNWTLTVNPRLDTSPEHFHEWAPDHRSLTRENLGAKLHLRVELQALFRLPRSNAILFSIRCYMASLQDLIGNPAWGCRLHRVLRDLPAPLVEYKGLSPYHPLLLEWLRPFDPEAR